MIVTKKLSLLFKITVVAFSDPLPTGKTCSLEELDNFSTENSDLYIPIDKVNRSILALKPIINLHRYLHIDMSIFKTSILSIDSENARRSLKIALMFCCEKTFRSEKPILTNDDIFDDEINRHREIFQIYFPLDKRIFLEYKRKDFNGISYWEVDSANFQIDFIYNHHSDIQEALPTDRIGGNYV